MIAFSKMQGNGNDFIIIDELEGELIGDKSNFAKKYCDRRFGIGADGVLYLCPSKKADLRMRIFQPDGSEAEMCGNGIRCLVKYAIDEGYVEEGSVTIETMTGILSVEANDEIRTNMGRPKLEFLKKNLDGWSVSAVDVGVPHAVIFVDDIDVDLDEIALGIRYNPIFPNGANVNLVAVESLNRIKIRTYERGVEAETLSCGTGATACALISERLNRIEYPVEVVTKGGKLRITERDGFLFMEGTTEKVYEGVIP